MSDWDLSSYLRNDYCDRYSESEELLDSGKSNSGKSPKTAMDNFAGSEVKATAPNQATH